jgi:hypothetical protein
MTVIQNAGAIVPPPEVGPIPVSLVFTRRTKAGPVGAV